MKYFQILLNPLLKHENKVAFFIIFLFVLAFNLEAIFGLKCLIQDDFGLYFDAINGNDAWFSDRRALNNFFLIHYGVYVARFINVLFFSIPLSFCIFYLNRRYFKFKLFPALFGAIIINILPFQTLIPTFLDGSYPLIGLTIVFISIIASLEYLYSKKLLMLFLASSLWYLSNFRYTIAELNIFIFPPVFMLIAVYVRGISKEKLALLSIFTLISGYRIYLILSNFYSNNSRGSGTPQDLSLERIQGRIENAINWSSLIPYTWVKDNHALLTILIFLFCFVAGSIVLAKYKGIFNRKTIFISILFYFSLSVLTLFPFLTVSRWFSIRHIFVGLVGVYVLFILFFDLIIRYVFKKSKFVSIISFITLIILVAFTGLHRLDYIKKYYSRHNMQYAKITGQLDSIACIKPNSQFIFTNYSNDLGLGGHFKWTSGLFSYYTKKPNIIGIIGKEESFYNPFLGKYRNYFTKLGGIDINRPTFAFNYKSNTFFEVNYMLQWEEEDNKESIWNIFKINSETNELLKIKSGTDIDEYILFLKNSKIKPNEILFSKYDEKRSWTKIILDTTEINISGIKFDSSYIEPINDFGYPEWTINLWINPQIPIPNSHPYYKHYSIIEGENIDNFLGINNYGGLSLRYTTICYFDFTNNEGWHYITYKYSNGILTGIVDGINIGSIKTTNPLASIKRRRIGQRGNNIHLYRGKLSHIQIWNRELSLIEINDSKFKKFTGKEPGLMAYWPLNNIDTTANEIIDITKNKNIGKIIGNSTIINEKYIEIPSNQ
jgi:hypothetical protein